MIFPCCIDVACMFCVCSAGGQVLHSAAAHTAASAHGLPALVRPSEAVSQRHQQRAVRLLHEPHRR